MDWEAGLFGKMIARLTWLLLAACLANALATSSASAQSTVGWVSGHAKYPFGDPDDACRSQHGYYMGGYVGSHYVGAFPWPGRQDVFGCQWTSFMNGCVGGISICGTTRPAIVWLACTPGYSPETGICRKDPTPERPCDRRKNPKIGNPIILSTCAKVVGAVDYSAGDGGFVISRSYRSTQVGRSASFQTPIRGLAGGWNFDFAYELQLTAFSGSPSSPNARLALVAPDGTAYDFVMQSGGGWVPDSTTGAFYAPTDLKVEYVGALPSDLSTLQSASTDWKVTDGDDTVWAFQTFTRPNSTSAYAVGRPISRVTRNGYEWTFAYRGDDSLQTITDSFGRQATFNWSTFYMTTQSPPPAGFLPWPEAVSSVSLPDGTSLKYTYDPPPATAAPSSPAVAGGHAEGRARAIAVG